MITGCIFIRANCGCPLWMSNGLEIKYALDHHRFTVIVMNAMIIFFRTADDAIKPVLGGFRITKA